MAKKKMINDRCPFEGECCRKTCDFKFKEKQCGYYSANETFDDYISDQRTKPIEDLDALIAGPDEETDEYGIKMLPITELFPHPDNPRKELGDLTELANSIKAKGVMQNLTVVRRAEGGYTVIIGHRRRAASEVAGITELPCVIAEMTPQEQLETMLLENMQRVDLTAYEQAQGFQLMMNFGDTVEEISEKTGFSPTTVRRRIKLCELDQEKLKTVSSRQISITDLDKLSKIDSIAERNNVLEYIGTNNFESRLASTIKTQNIKKMSPVAKALVKKLKAKKISYSETYGGKYQRLGQTIYLNEWDGVTIPVKSDETRKLYYLLDDGWGKFEIYVETPKKKPVKRPAEEIEREKRIDEAWSELDSMTSLHHQLRMDFVKSLNVNSKNTAEMFRGAVVACTLNVFGYVSGTSELAREALSIEDGADTLRRSLIAVADVQLSAFPQIIYAAFGDCNTNGYKGGWKGSFPYHADNVKLDALYRWLCSVGYQMSDDEIALQNGTHEVLKRGEKEKEITNA